MTGIAGIADWQNTTATAIQKKIFTDIALIGHPHKRTVIILIIFV
jgi:hypothetical protein